MNTSSSAQQYVNQAMAFMQQGRFKAALELFLTLEQAGMQDPRLFRSMGAAYERLGSNDEACQYFERSLQMDKSQSDLYLSIARIHHRQKQFDHAEKWFKSARDEYPSSNSYLASGFFYVSRGTHYLDIAQRLFLDTENQFGDSERVQLGLAQVMADKGQWQAQNAMLNKSVARYPTSIALARALAWSNKQCGKYDQAIANYKVLINGGNTNEDDQKRLALTFLEQGDMTRAKFQLEQGLMCFPDSRALQRLMASIRYELGEDNFLESYNATSLAKRPLPLALDYVDQCIDAGNFGHANKALTQLERSNAHHPLLINRRAKLAYKCEDDEQCISLVSSLLCTNTDNQALIELRALAALSAGHYDVSRSDIKSLLSLAPHDQFYWALQSVQWRIDDDSRYQWLCSYDDLVKRVPLALSDKYKDSSEYLVELAHTLNALHHAQHHPLTQSLREGTQTPGDLLMRQEPNINVLALALRTTALNTLSTLSVTTEHPAYIRRLESVNFSASWSVKLKRKGFHASHVHPKGWYSSAFYVQVPPTNNKQGWLHLGAPGIRLNVDLPAEKWIKPEPGMLVLFPSYMWHGTAPFENSDTRLSVAFDLLPNNR